jgi:hypothetical protein
MSDSVQAFGLFRISNPGEKLQKEQKEFIDAPKR